MKFLIPIMLFLFFSLLFNCGRQNGKLKITQEKFGQTEDGQQVDIYTLTNANGMQVRITNYGATVQSLTAADRKGNYEDIVLGYDSLKDYIKDSPYFGAIVGRFGNRIAKGKFTLNGVEYTLATNNGPNHLHGGIKGFDKVLWKAKPFKSDSTAGLELTYLSKDGEEGYPGNLNVKLVYTLNNKNELKMEYTATTDKPTPVNLTNHSYFNFSGCKTDILNHELWINADRFTPVDSTLIPTGELRSVQGTPFDFTTPTAIGQRINDDNTQLKYGGGYDHNWVLNNVDGKVKLQASVYEPGSGRLLQVYSDQPGLQFYSGNFLNGSNTGKGGIVYKHRYALVLETQHYPDSPNQPDFPSTILNPGETYQTKTIYRFTTK